jgi:hypothetical protein
MMRQFIKVGTLVFQVSNINVIDLDVSDGYIDVYTSDCTEKPFKVKSDTPESDALIAWATNPARCSDLAFEVK